MSPLGILFWMIIGLFNVAVSLYYIVMSWRHPVQLQQAQLERIDKLGKHPLAGVSRLWVASASWIWFVRVASIFMFLGTCFALILALLSLAGFVTLPLIHFTDTQLPEHPGAGYSKAMEMENGVRLVMKIAKLPARGP
jgi:hypothetical protein